MPCPAETPICGAGVCGVAQSNSAAPSCAGLAANCGKDGNLDCCGSNLVPGGSFNRSNDASFPATVSPFRLDNFEVTLGRFRKFVAAYTGPTMTAQGAGKNPNNSADMGWNSAWDTFMPANQAGLIENVKHDDGSSGYIWSDTPGGDENRPMNMVSWYESLAFCIWDGGRLPTEAEWNFAAAGGSNQWAYSWGNNDPMADANLTIWGCHFDPPLAASDCGNVPGLQWYAPVGSAPAGNARWGQSDLIGNAQEWVQDRTVDYVVPCNDCASLGANAQDGRVIRGGLFYATELDGLHTYDRQLMGVATDRYQVGFRCARNP